MWPSGTLVNDADDLANLHVGAGSMINAAQNTGRRGGHFEIHLVGFEFHDRLAKSDEVAGVLHPTRDASLDDRFADFGNDNLY